MLFDNDTPALRLRCKVVLVGDAGVGKTSIFKVGTISQQEFRKEYNATSNVNLNQKCVKISGQDAEVEFFVLDTPGLDLWMSQADAHVVSANFVLFVCDITQPDIENRLQYWHQRITELRNDSVRGAVILNKVDLLDEAAVESSSVYVKKFADSKGLLFFEASAVRYDRSPVDKIFMSLANSYFTQFDECREHAKALGSS